MSALRIHWKLGLAVLAIVGVGVVADAMAVYVITYDGASCYICEDISQVAICNENNADYIGNCNPGELATDCHVVDGRLVFSCDRSN